jgi:hypothetical protein
MAKGQLAGVELTKPGTASAGDQIKANRGAMSQF